MRQTPQICTHGTIININPQKNFFSQPLPYMLTQNLPTVRPCRLMQKSKKIQNINQERNNGPIVIIQRNQQITKIKAEPINVDEVNDFSSIFLKKVKQSFSHVDLTRYSQKSEMSENLVQKLKSFEPSLAGNSTKLNYKEKQKLFQSLNLIKNEVSFLKQLVQSQVIEKVKEMHRIYSDGNRKSIELVMMIVRQLEKENQILKHKISQMNQYQVNQINQCNQCQHHVLNQQLANTLQEIQYIQQKQGRSLKLQTKTNLEDKSLISYLESHESQVSYIDHARVSSHMESEQDKSSQLIQQSYDHAQSILLIGDQLEVIEQIQNDDDYQSIHQKLYSSFNQEQNTFSSKSLDSHTVGRIDQQNISPFKNHSLNNLVDQQNSQNLLTTNMHQQFDLKEDEEQSMIVKKLLKLKKKSNRKSQPNKINESAAQTTLDSFNEPLKKHFIPLINQSCFQQNQEQENESDLSLPFDNISLPTIQVENPHSISEALSILKEYNQNEPIQEEINQIKNRNQKNQRVKAPAKISLLVTKKIQQNKENIFNQQPKKEIKYHSQTSTHKQIYPPSNRLIYSKIESLFPLGKFLQNNSLPHRNL